MWTGAFPNKSAPIKAFMPIRGELSILAAILTLCHNVYYGRTYFVRLFTDSEHMSTAQVTAAVLSLAMLAIMIPLTVMSFPKVRKKMNAKVWKKIQRTAYLFYAMIYLHVTVLFVGSAKSGGNGYIFNIAIYGIVFIGYAVCRIEKHCIVRNKTKHRKIRRTVLALFFVLAVSLPCVYAKSEIIENDGKLSKNDSVENVGQTEEDVFREEDVSNNATIPTPLPNDTNETEYSEQDNAESKRIYNDGIYTGKAYGYDGEITVEITVENGIVTNITGKTYESDPFYFESAWDYIIEQIKISPNSNADVLSGATYSSNAIKDAVAFALAKAEIK